MSRAAMDRINAKVDEAIKLPEPPRLAADESPRRSARAERMARSDRWERQVTAEPAPMPVHHAEANPALLAAQDAAADSLMGNRAQRHTTHSTPLPSVAVEVVVESVALESSTSVSEAQVAEPAPTQSVTSAPKIQFEIKHESIAQTTAQSGSVVSEVKSGINPVATFIAQDNSTHDRLAHGEVSHDDAIHDHSAERDPAVMADNVAHHEPRRPMRRGLYRRRVVGNRKPRRTTDEHAVSEFAPQQSNDHSEH